MKQFLIVLKFELNNYFKNKSFMVTTALLAIVVAAVIIVPTMIPGFLDDSSQEETSDVYTEEQAAGYEDIGGDLGILFEGDELEDPESLLQVYPAKWSVFDSVSEMKKAVENGEIEAGFVLKSPSEVTYIVDNLSMNDYLAESFSQTLSQYYKEQYLLQHGLTPEQILESESIYVNVTKEILGKNSVQSYGYTYVLVFVVYFLIIFYGQMIATSVTTEKSNRAIEILVTSVNSNSLIFGKVLAGAIAGILQASVILGSAFAAYSAAGSKWGGMLDFLFDIPTEVLVTYIIFALLSYVLYAFIFGTLGAMVSKTEDISKSATPITMIYVASFLIAMFGMTNSDSVMMKVASFIPFTSGNAMFIRVSMGNVTMIEIILSALILLGSCVAAGVLAAKLFRFGTLHYGNPIKIKTALKKVFTEK